MVRALITDGAAPVVDCVDFQLLDRPSQRCQELALGGGTERQTRPSQCESRHPPCHTGQRAQRIVFPSAESNLESVRHRSVSGLEGFIEAQDSEPSLGDRI